MSIRDGDRAERRRSVWRITVLDAHQLRLRTEWRNGRHAVARSERRERRASKNFEELTRDHCWRMEYAFRARWQLIWRANFDESKAAAEVERIERARAQSRAQADTQRSPPGQLFYYVDAGGTRDHRRRTTSWRGHAIDACARHEQ